MRWLSERKTMRSGRARALALSGVVNLAAYTLAVAQPSAGTNPTWSGWARCDIDVVASGYSDRESHLWILAPSPPTTQGATRIYTATWSAVGTGSLKRIQGSQSLDAQWTMNVPAMPAPIGLTVRASDGRLLIKPAHAQLRAAGGVTGTQQVTIDGKPQPPGAIAREAFEWSFPSIEVAATVAVVAGSSVTPIAGSVGLMQPAGARATASCTWQLARGTLATSRSGQTIAAGPTTGSAVTPRAVAPPTIIPSPVSPAPATPSTLGSIPTATRTRPASGGTTGVPAVGTMPTAPSTTPPPGCSLPLAQPAGAQQSTAPARTSTSGSGSVLPPPPGTCPDIYQPLADLEAWLANVGSDLGEFLARGVASLVAQVAASRAGGSPPTCTDLARDVDAAFSRFIQQAQTAYNGLKSAAVTPQEQKAVDTSEKNTDLAALRGKRDKAIADILALCR